MPSLHPITISESPMLLRVSPQVAESDLAEKASSQCSVTVPPTSASVCVGWNWSVSPFQTGTPECAASAA